MNEDIMQYIKVLDSKLKEFDYSLSLKPQRTFSTSYEFLITSNKKYDSDKIISLLGDGWNIDSDWFNIYCFYIFIHKDNLYRNMRNYYLKELSS